MRYADDYMDDDERAYCVHGSASLPWGFLQGKRMPTAEIEAVTARISEVEQELRDLIVLSTRLLSDNGSRTSFDAVLTRYGYTREQLEAIPDEE